MYLTRAVSHLIRHVDIVDQYLELSWHFYIFRLEDVDGLEDLRAADLQHLRKYIEGKLWYPLSLIFFFSSCWLITQYFSDGCAYSTHTYDYFDWSRHVFNLWWFKGLISTFMDFQGRWELRTEKSTKASRLHQSLHLEAVMTTVVNMRSRMPRALDLFARAAMERLKRDM